MQFCSRGSPKMDTGFLGLEKDAGEDQFQQELSRWFESRGIIANLRSHLRHLMIMALQSTQIGQKPTTKSSPKAQAVSLVIAEYLFVHRCHYTLSVFTSEASNLVDFHSDVFQNGNRKRQNEKCFQENQVEEIFNALGISSREEELTHLKSRYLDKGNDSSMVELFLQTVVEMSTKLLVLQNLKSHEVNGERLLSEEWSSRIVDILMSEKMTSPQITALEEAIFRVTENEMRKIVENERKQQIRLLSEREKRIQEYLNKHKDEILLRLIEAEKNLTMQKDVINEELTGREKHLTEMVMEWRSKHEEILKLSKDFHNIESENKVLQKKLKVLEEENSNLKLQKKTQSRTIEDLQEEMTLLKNKLKETTDSNALLNEKIQELTNKDNEEFICHDNAYQKTIKANSDEVPLHKSENMISDYDIDPSNRHNKELEPKFKCKDLAEKYSGEWNITEPSEDENVSSSSEETILNVRKRLQNLEEETDRINRSYLEYKLKCLPVESDSESWKNLSDKSPQTVHDDITTKETKSCQTNGEDPLIKMEKLKGLEKRKMENFSFVTKKSEDVSPSKPLMREPSKRQLAHRDFFLKNRQLLRTLQKQKLESFHIDLSDMETSSSEKEFLEDCRSYNKKSPLKSILTGLLRTASTHSIEAFEIKNEPLRENVKKVVADDIMQKDLDCLALLEQTRIRSPPISGRLRLFGLDKEEIDKEEQDDDGKIETCSAESFESSCTGKALVDKKNEKDDAL